MAKFERAVATKSEKPTVDAEGKVRIQVFLVNEKNIRVSGNVSRTITLKDTTVTAVGDAIEKALLE